MSAREANALGGRNAQAKLTTEERRRRGRKAARGQTKAERSAARRKAWDTRRANRAREYLASPAGQAAKAEREGPCFCRGTLEPIDGFKINHSPHSCGWILQGEPGTSTFGQVRTIGGMFSAGAQQLEALAGAVGLRGAVVKVEPNACTAGGFHGADVTPICRCSYADPVVDSPPVEQASKPKRPLPKAGTNGARVIEVMTLMRAEGLEGINSVTIAMRAGFDRATTRAALAHLTTAGHVVSVPKPGSRREKLWRVA